MAPYPAIEAQHLDALHQAPILDAQPEEAFDDLARPAAPLCLAASVCGGPMMTPEGSTEGLTAGSLGVLDGMPRSLTREQQAVLQALARQAADQIEMTRRAAQQEQLIAGQQAALETLQQNQLRLLEAQQVAKIGSWEYDVATNRVTWSPEMFRLLGFKPADGEPDHETLLSHYDPEDIALHDGMLLQALEDGLPYEYDIRILQSQELMRWGHVVGQAVRGESGKIVRLSGTLMDITDRKQAEEENARLAAIIEHSSDAVLGLTLDGTLVSWNHSAERLYGYQESEVIGQHMSVLIAPEQDGFASSALLALKRGEQRGAQDMRGQRKDGTFVETVQTFSPIRNPAGKLVGAAATGQDVTEQRRAEETVRRGEEAVRRSETRLAEAQRVAHIGSWEIDAATQEVAFSEEMYHLFELDPTAGMPPLECLLARYHPDDVAAHTALVAQCWADHKPFVNDIRIVRQSGEIRWVHIIGKPVLDGSGNMRRLIGTMMDVTDRVQVEERFRVLFEHSPEAHFLLNAGGIIDCNDAALQMFRCSREDMAAVHPKSLSPQYQPDGTLSSVKGRAIHEAIAQTGAQEFEWVHQRRDGEQFPAKVIATPVTLEGKPAMLSVIHDLTEQKRAAQRIQEYAVILERQKRELEQANRELCDLATTDGLTGLKNHRAFQERILEECGTAQRHGTPLSLLLLDVDHFKQFNDTFGHPAGDAVLKQVARLLEQTMRDCDFVARYGGEEFVVVLPQTDQAGALWAAERYRLAISSAKWSVRPVTASFGVATLSAECSGSDALIAAADQAMYAAKSNGRNQVMHMGSFCKSLLARQVK